MTEQEQTTQIELLKQSQKMTNDKIDNLKGVVVSGFKDLKLEISEIKNDMKEMDVKNEHKYASKLTEKIVYGLVSLILVAVIGAVITLTLK